MRSTIALPLMLVAASSLLADSGPTLPRGHVFYSTNFDQPSGVEGWSGSVKLGPGRQTGQSLFFERAAGSPGGSSIAYYRLPVEAMRGYLVRFNTAVKAENVSPKPQPWNGVKFMAATVTKDGRLWPAVSLDAGTFDWQTVGFQFRVPDDATEIRLALGLESVTGKAWFDDVRVVVWKPPMATLARAAGGPVFKGHALPRLRGAMIGSNASQEDLRVFGQEWKANLIRWQLIRKGGVADPLDLAAYDAWLESALHKLDEVLPWCQKYGLLVAVDLHSPPGGRKTSGGYAGSDHGLFTNAACQRRFIELWGQIARRYKDSPAVWGYDLANEPVEAVGPEGLDGWQELAEKAAREIRAIDPQRAIIVEPPQWGSPEGLKELIPLAIPNVVYSVHMYKPGEFTHQGVHRSGDPVAYPGVIAGRPWDKATLEKELQVVANFQKAYGVHIYIGEFSAIRWAPGQSAYQYLRDLIDIFEAHGWDWSYHAFREWDGWSVEHGPDRNDRQPATTPTDRQQLLRVWYSKNQKPSGRGGIR